VARVRASFIEPMLLLRKEALADQAAVWRYELKLDGYRAVAFKAANAVHLRSRNDKDFATGYPTIAQALAKLLSDTVIDGEIVAVDENGKPSFTLLQNYRSLTTLVYFVFDLMIVRGA